MKPSALSVLAALCLAVPVATAVADPVPVQDAQGRPFVIDARVGGVDVAPYVSVLSGAVHGDEIRDLTVRIVPVAAIPSICNDRHAVACYSRSRSGDGVITVPPTLSRVQRGSLLHEYGHHIDAAYDNGSRTDPNGTPGWWSARRMGTLVRSGRAAHSYARGWSRSVGEIFAEDYMVMNGGGRSGIRWLRQPSARVRAALRADILGYAGPRPSWPPGDASWRGFTSGPVGAGQLVTMQAPVAGARQGLEVVARPDAPRGITPLTLTVSCPGVDPFTTSGARGEGLEVRVVAPTATTCAIEVRSADDRPGGASLQVVVAPASPVPGS